MNETTIMSVWDVNYMLAHDVDATTHDLVGGAEPYIRMDPKGEKHIILQLRQTSMIVEYYNILQNER